MKMNKKISKKIYIVLITAFLFTLTTMPFKTLFRIIPGAELRPAAVLNPVCGLLFGLPGALGCAFGDFLGNILSGTSLTTCLLFFCVQVIYGYLPFLLWKLVKSELRLNTGRNVLCYSLIMLINCIVMAVLLGIVMHLCGYRTFWSMGNFLVFASDLAFCLVLGMPILIFLTFYKNKKYGKTPSVNELLILAFISLAILSAALLGFIVYYEAQNYITNELDLWNRVYGYVIINLFAFCIVMTIFIYQSEKRITMPLENLAVTARQYVCAGSQQRLDTEQFIERCTPYVTVKSEAGDLAKAFQDMAGSIHEYVEHITRITAENERISVELNLAKEIQASMLPNSFPKRDDIALYACTIPAKAVGGDFYDFFFIDEQHIALIIADVSDKGVPAALFMAKTKTLLKNQALTKDTPKDIFMKVNQQLCENNKAQMFVTVWLGILDISTGLLTAANAGHECPVIRRKNSPFSVFQDEHSFILGGMENIPYSEYEIQLYKGDTIFVYTDGVAEATDCNNQLYGTTRMLSALNASPNASPADLISNIHEDIKKFVGTALQHDDITMLAFTFGL